MRTICLFILLLCFSATLNAGSPEQLFEQANSSYQENNFNQAILLYDSILQQDFVHPETYYNLGNAHFRNGNLGFAILNYEKALVLNPKDEDAQHNLALANKQVVDEFNVVPTPALKRIFSDFSSLFSSGTWSLIALVFFGIVLIASIIFLFYNRQATLLVALAIAFVLGLCIEGIAYGKHQLETQDFAVLTVPNSYIKSAPADGAEDLFILHEGTKVLVLDAFSDWNKIKLPDGKIGWISSEGLSAI